MKTITTVFIGLLSATLVGAAPPKNVLFIAVDDLKPLLGSYGSHLAITPHIDQLAKAGTTFLNAHCQVAVCGPSRVSVLTGHYPDTLGIYGMSGDRNRLRPNYPDMVTLPQHFKNHGYITLGTGKIFDPRNLEDDWQGPQDVESWTEFFGTNPYNKEFGGPSIAGHYHNPSLRDLVDRLTKEGKAKGLNGKALRMFVRDGGGGPAVEAYDAPDDAYQDGAIANRGIEQLGRLRDSDQPFFLALGFLKPHLPFVAPQKYWEWYDREKIELAPNQAFPVGAPELAKNDYVEARSYSGVPAEGPISEETQRELIHGYLACVSYVDAQIGRVVAKLREIGRYEDTVIVLWGDHGFHLGDKQLFGKHTNYEQSTRVPLIIANAGTPGGQKTNAPTNLIDIFPTLCELTGLPAPRVLDGKSLAPVMGNRAESVQKFAASLYPSNGYWGIAIRTERYRYVAWYKAKQSSNTHGLRFAAKPEAVELYDYKEDPLELRNLSGQPAYAKAEKELAQLHRQHTEFTQSRQFPRPGM